MMVADHALLDSVFIIAATNDANLLPRLLQLLAQRGLAPERLAMRDRRGRTMIYMRVRGLDPSSVKLIGEKMRSMILVERVKIGRPPGQRRTAESQSSASSSSSMRM